MTLEIPNCLGVFTVHPLEAKELVCIRVSLLHDYGLPSESGQGMRSLGACEVPGAQ